MKWQVLSELNILVTIVIKTLLLSFVLFSVYKLLWKWNICYLVNWYHVTNWIMSNVIVVYKMLLLLLFGAFYFILIYDHFQWGEVRSQTMIQNKDSVVQQSIKFIAIKRKNDPVDRILAWYSRPWYHSLLCHKCLAWSRKSH